MRAVQAIVLDFSGVVCHHPTREDFAQLAQRLEVPLEQLWDAFWLYRREYDLGLPPAQYWHKVGDVVGRAIEGPLLRDMIRLEVALWNRYDWRVVEWVGQVRSTGVRTALLSNLPQPLGEQLRIEPGFLDPFEQVTFSYELRMAKPDREIYEHTLKAIGVAAKDTLFLDDRAENVEGALAAGMLAEVFTSWEDFAAGGPARYALPAAAVARRQ